MTCAINCNDNNDCLGCSIHKRFKYILSKSDVDGIYKGVPKKTSFVYSEGDDYIMDYDSVSKLKSKFSMDVIINTNFKESTFDDFLNNRMKPYYKIYSFVSGGIIDNVDIFKPPFEIDFKSDLIISFNKKVLPKNKGVPTRTEYYESKKIINYQGNNVAVYDNIICKVDFELIYDDLGFITQKKSLLKWYLSNETCDEDNFKDIGRVFDPFLDSGKIIKEGVDRRRTIYDEMLIPSLMFLSAIFPDKGKMELVGIGRDFMAYYKDGFDAFIYESRTILDQNNEDFGMKEIVSLIKRDTVHNWLDTVVNIGFGDISPRQYMINELSI